MNRRLTTDAFRPSLQERGTLITLKILPPGANMEGRLGLEETPRLRAGLTSLCCGVVGLCIGLRRNSQIKPWVSTAEGAKGTGLRCHRKYEPELR